MQTVLESQAATARGPNGVLHSEAQRIHVRLGKAPRPDRALLLVSASKSMRRALPAWLVMGPPVRLLGRRGGSGCDNDDGADPAHPNDAGAHRRLPPRPRRLEGDVPAAGGEPVRGADIVGALYT
jgi:hypothetical protein